MKKAFFAAGQKMKYYGKKVADNIVVFTKEAVARIMLLYNNAFKEGTKARRVMNLIKAASKRSSVFLRNKCLLIVNFCKNKENWIKLYDFLSRKDVRIAGCIIFVVVLLGTTSYVIWDIFFNKSSFSAAELNRYLAEEVSKDDIGYQSLKTECKQREQAIQAATNECRSWESDQDFYIKKNKELSMYEIHGYVHRRLDDGWYIFSNGNEFGAFKLVEGKQYTTTGNFRLKCIPGGLQDFYLANGTSTRLPVFIEATTRQKALGAINFNMVISARNNQRYKEILINEMTEKLKEMKILLEKKDPKENKIVLSTKDMKDIVDDNKTQTLAKLIQKGLDINYMYEDNKEKYTILIYAVKQKKNDLIKILLKNNVFIDACGRISLPNNNKIVHMSALGMAMLYDSIDAAKLLLRNNAIVNNGYAPYELAWLSKEKNDSEKLIQRWELLNEFGGKANYIDTAMDDHFIIKIVQTENDIKILHFLLFAARVSPWQCTLFEYGPPHFTETAWELISQSYHRLE